MTGVKIGFLRLLLILLFAPACRSSAPTVARPVPTILPDTSENRQLLAAEVVRAYPREEFVRDFRRRVAEITGSEVVDQVRERLAAELTPEQVQALRIKLYAEYFTPRQLELLRDLYASGDGRVILNNMRRLDDDLIERVKPLILEALSNKPASE